MSGDSLERIGKQPVVIGLCGKAGSGKDTVARLLRDRIGLGARLESLAEPLKKGVHTMLSLPFPGECIDKEAILSDVLRTDCKNLEFSLREAYQRFGTEGGRRLQDDLWVALLENRIENNRTAPFPLIIVPDVRFVNEADWVRDRGVLIYVNRGDTPKVGIHGHASENYQLLIAKADYIIRNYGTLDDLRDQVNRSAEGILRHARTTSVFEPGVQRTIG